MGRSHKLIIIGLVAFGFWLMGPSPSNLRAADSLCPDPNQPADPTCNPECQEGDETVFCACHKLGPPDDPKGYQDHCSSCESRSGHCCHGDLAGMCNGCGNGTRECCTFLKDGEGKFILNASGNKVADQCCDLSAHTVEECRAIAGLEECEAEACDDGNNDGCSGGCSDDCKEVTCDDGNPCTADSCGEKEGECIHEPLTGASCDTGNGGCADVCVDGECTDVSTLPEMCEQNEDGSISDINCSNEDDDDCDGTADKKGAKGLPPDPKCDLCNQIQAPPQACEIITNTPPSIVDPDPSVHFPPRPSDPGDAMVTSSDSGDAFFIDILSNVSDSDGPDPTQIIAASVESTDGSEPGQVKVVNTDSGQQLLYIPPSPPPPEVLISYVVFDGESCNGEVSGSVTGENNIAGGGFCGLTRVNRVAPQAHELLLGLAGVGLIAGILMTVRSMVLVRRRRG